MGNLFAKYHPYVYFATRYPFSRGQQSLERIGYTSSLYLIAEGKGTLRTCGRTYETLPGALTYVPAGQPHDWIADADDPMVHVCCYFDWYYVDRTDVFQTFAPIRFGSQKLHRELIGPLFPYPLPEFMTVDRIAVWNDLFESFYTNHLFPDERSFLRNIKIQGNFQHFIDHYLTFALQQDNAPDPRMQKVVARMEQDTLNGAVRPLEAYYEPLRISRGYFFDRFKQATGFTPVQYMNHLRILRAKEDLRHTSLSVTDIAEKYRFSSIHYFSRLFHRMTGQTPSQFREESERG